MNLMAPRYPDVHVSLRTQNPYALISAVRLALRRSQVARSEIDRFTEQALETEEPQRMREVCTDWAEVTITA